MHCQESGEGSRTPRGAPRHHVLGYAHAARPAPTRRVSLEPSPWRCGYSLRHCASRGPAGANLSRACRDPMRCQEARAAPRARSWFPEDEGGRGGAHRNLHQPEMSGYPARLPTHRPMEAVEPARGRGGCLDSLGPAVGSRPKTLRAATCWKPPPDTTDKCTKQWRQTWLYSAAPRVGTVGEAPAL